MILVDTTVWVDFFRGVDSPEVAELQKQIESSNDVCICGVILTEVLQGIRDEKSYATAKAIFESFLYLPMTRLTFQRAAGLYRSLRARGITIRNAADCMIASVALEHHVPLLHNDRDFDAIAAAGDLNIVRTHGRRRKKADG